MKILDFSFFLEPPVLSVLAELKIEALSPLSLVVSQPGHYYRSQASPSEYMLYGLLENALGWHLDEDAKTGIKRKNMLRNLRKIAKKLQGRKSSWIHNPWLDAKHMPNKSAIGAWSLLQYHLHFESPHFLPSVERFDDLWSQQLHDNGKSFFGGSRNYDYRLENMVNRTRLEDPTRKAIPKSNKRPPYVEVGDRKKHKTLSFEEACKMERGTMNYKSVRKGFPQYFNSPKKREYVIPHGQYIFRVKTTKMLSESIGFALFDPMAPLYLGSNDGWVDATWEVL